MTHDIQKLCPQWQPTPESHPEIAADEDQSLRFRAPTLTPSDSSDDEGDGAPDLGAGRPGNTKLAHGLRPPMLHLSVDISTAKHLRPVLASGDHLSPWLVVSQPGSVQPSPIPHQLVNQSLTINGVPTATPTHGYFPAEASPVANVDQADLHMAGNLGVNNETLVPTMPLPSPISDNGDAVIGAPENTGDVDAEMGDCSPSSFTQTVLPLPSADSAGVYQQVPLVVADNQHISTCAAAPRRRSPLVMGYRADCNKCQCKVPGHYSHIRRP